MINHRVCAVVVTFNRKDLLAKCLNSLKDQSLPLDAIYVIDNASTDGTDKLLLDYKYIKEKPPVDYHGTWNRSSNIQNSVMGENIKFNYIKLSENTGGAGGFYEGVKRAYEDGYDWLWLMDDDAEPLEDALEKLSEYFDEENISALAGVVKNANNKIMEGHRGYSDFNSLRNYFLNKNVDPKLINSHNFLEIDDASFVGILVNKESVKNVGFPKKELFVHRDDTEYCIRLRSFGRILLITDSVILHKEYGNSNHLQKKFFGLKFDRMKYENYWISYYAVRNNIWLLRKYRRPLFYLWLMFVVSWFTSISAIILLDDKKFKRIRFVTAAYLDGLRGNFDNKKPKKILYS